MAALTRMVLLRRSLRFRVVVGVAVMCCFAGLAGASSVSSRPPGKVVYTAATPSIGPDSHSLFTARADGSGSAQLTSAPRWDLDQRWSPDGKQVAFTRVDLLGVYSTVWVVNVDGSDAHAVADSAYAELPKWSPDGRWIAYQEQTDFGTGGLRANTSFDLWIVRPDGTKSRMLTSGGTAGSSADFIGQGSAWAWSPDGKQIAVVSEPGEDRFVIGVVNVATGRRRFVGNGMYFAWEPNGKRLVLGTGKFEGSGVCTGLWLVPASGGTRQRVPGARNTCDTDPAWSPDGRWIAFSRNDAGPWVVRPDGTQRARSRRVTAASVKWPSDCSRLFFYRSWNASSNSWNGWILPAAKPPKFVSLPTSVGGSDWHC